MHLPGLQDSQDSCLACQGTLDAWPTTPLPSTPSLTLQDSQDPNPLIRALAVRTMGCIRVDKITEYLCDPLHRCLKVGLW